MFADQQGEIDHATEPLADIIVVFPEDLLLLQITPDVEPSIIVHPSDGAAFSWDDAVVRQGRRRHVGNDGVKPKGVGAGFVERNAGPIPGDDLLDLIGDDAPQALDVPLGIEGIGDFEERLKIQGGALHHESEIGPELNNAPVLIGGRAELSPDVGAGEEVSIDDRQRNFSIREHVTPCEVDLVADVRRVIVGSREDQRPL